MNAAFLLVTSALLVGQAGDKKPATPPPAATPAVSSCCGQDSCGCDGFGHRLRDRLRGLFNRNSCDSCQQPTTCCNTGHARAPLSRSGCDDCGRRTWNWQPACREPRQHCAPATCNDCCGSRGGGLFERLRGGFHRGDSCCDGGCASTTPVKTGEPINPPKQMPKGGAKKPQEVRIETQPVPFAPNANPVAPTVPSVEIAPVPAPAPRIDGARRDPF